jgi:hypothetical protein
MTREGRFNIAAKSATAKCRKPDPDDEIEMPESEKFEALKFKAHKCRSA